MHNFRIILILILTAAAWITLGPKAGLVALAGVSLSLLVLDLIAEMISMHRYRDEYRACANAVLSNDEDMVDAVNGWTTHYYVHKTFQMSADREGLNTGYRYSIRDRPRRDDLGGGGYFTWF